MCYYTHSAAVRLNCADFLHTGVAGRVASKPFLLPETFNGDSEDEWMNPIESCADVNSWTKDEDK